MSSTERAESGIPWFDEGERRFMADFPKPTPGQLLYERWCGSRRSDRARYWHQMNPAERSAWENVAEDFIEADPDVFERVVRNLREYRG